MQDTLRARLSGELDSLREKHLYRKLRVVSGEQKAVCVIDESTESSSRSWRTTKYDPVASAAAESPTASASTIVNRRRSVTSPRRSDSRPRGRS